MKAKVITNDIVDVINENEFIWLGRYDNVINSGGIKLFPEQIEAKLQDAISDRFFIASEKDEKLGEKVILVIESNKKDTDASIFDVLEKFEKPKAIYFVSKFTETKTGKINRIKTLEKK